MALTETSRLYELLVRLTRTETGDRILGMQVSRITEIARDGEAIAANVEPAEELDFAGLVELMHPDDKAALAAAMAAST